MSGKLILDKDYKEWIGQLSIQYRNAQIKAAVAVNTEMLRFYWELGRDIVKMQSENRYGSHFFETLSWDLKEEIPEAKGFSVRNLKYIKNFYLMYSPILPQKGNNLLPNYVKFHGDIIDCLEISFSMSRRQHGSILRI